MPSEQQDKVLEYMEYVHTTPDVEQDLEKFFDLLSTTLKQRVLFEIHESTLDKVDILKDHCSPIEKSFIISNLHIAIFMKHDEIVRQGEEGDKLYFINKGAVSVSIAKVQYERLSDETIVAGEKWETMKKTAMKSDYKDNDWFVSTTFLKI